MYSDGLIVTILTSEGKTLRESGAKVTGLGNPFSKFANVYLPFDSEYKLYFKNQLPRKASIKIEIDGTDILGGHSLVVGANSVVVLDRFMLDGNLNSGKKLKFVSINHADVQNPSEPKNGLVRISARFEEPVFVQTGTPYSYSHYFGDTIESASTGPFDYTSNTPTHTLLSGRSGRITGQQVNCCSYQRGATVEGGQSNQKFTTMTLGTLGSEVVMEFQILAPSQTEYITTEDTKHIYCSMCGKRMRRASNFCSRCGNKLG